MRRSTASRWSRAHKRPASAATLAAILAAGLAALVTGCGSSGNSSSAGTGANAAATSAAASTSSAAAGSSSKTTPAGASPAPAQPGASLAIGQTATVRFAPLASITKVTSTLRVTVESVQRGTLADFNGIQLDASEKAGTPDYVTVAITNVGPAAVSSDDASADIQGVDNTGNTQQSVTFIGDFPRCNDTSTGASLAPGHALHTCLTFLVPGGITKVAYTGTEDYENSPVTWSAK